MQRRGPRPLLLHLAMAMATPPNLNDCAPGLPNWSKDWRNWSNWPRWINAASVPDADPFASIDASLLGGIAAYRRHPYRRALFDPPAIWQEGSTRLLDFQPQGNPAVLFVPSLVNRAYILDLAENNSAMRALARAGLRPLLLDWGWPELAERRFTLTDYITGRLQRALSAACVATAGPVILAGYCMGGLLAVAAAQARPDQVRALALLATPWDFRASLDEETCAALPHLASMVGPATALTGALPVDLLQSLFALRDPGAIAAKYRAFGTWSQDSQRAQHFVALEDWLNDGVPLAGPVAEECISGWYGANSPASGNWRVAGLPVDPSLLRLPSFLAIPAKDRIVPPDSALPLADLIPNAVVLRPAAGHISMAVGRRAASYLWEPLVKWIAGV
jgi:polyhydroxyalkanoate synthase